MASAGNAADFGDLSSGVQSPSSLSNATRGLYNIGNTPSGKSNVIDKITIASTGDAADFGDLTVAKANASSGSTAHGGLQ